jgi:cysteine-rich repeat protein
MVWRIRWVWLAVLAASASCGLSTDTAVCASGQRCPTGQLCVDGIGEAGLCVQPDQVRQCQGEDDGALCSFGGAEGACLSGVCFAGQCGDGAVQAGEVCDDGNTDSGDGCAGNCLSDESCGNGVIDVDEECDCGTSAVAPGCLEANSDSPGAACRTDCLAHCGDGEVNEAEDCDSAPPDSSCLLAGFDAGRLECSAVCTTDFGDCERFGWAEVPLGAGAVVVDIWASPSGRIYALTGIQGRLFEFDGTTAKTATVGTPSRRLWGRSDDEIYFAGRGVTLFNGTEFYPQELPAATDDLVFDHIVGTPTRVYVGASDAGAIFAYDGVEWSQIDDGQCGQLTALAAAAGTLWAGCQANLRQYVDGGWSTLHSFPGDLSAILAVDGQLKYATANTELWNLDQGNWGSVLATTRSRHGIEVLADGRIALLAIGSFYADSHLWILESGRWAPIETPGGYMSTFAAIPGGGLVLGTIDTLHVSGARVRETLPLLGYVRIWSQGVHVAAQRTDVVTVYDGQTVEEKTVVPGTGGDRGLWGSSLEELHGVFGGTVYARQGDASWLPLPGQPAEGPAFGTGPQNVVVMAAEQAHHWNGSAFAAFGGKETTTSPWARTEPCPSSTASPGPRWPLAPRSACSESMVVTDTSTPAA